MDEIVGRPNKESVQRFLDEISGANTKGPLPYADMVALTRWGYHVASNPAAVAEEDAGDEKARRKLLPPSAERARAQINGVIIPLVRLKEMAESAHLPARTDSEKARLSRALSDFLREKFRGRKDDYLFALGIVDTE